MLYYIVRPIARLALWLYYRKIYLSHLERIPQGKPVILASNHPTAFMEPCLMAVFMRQPLHYLVRGDFFQNPLYNFLLRSLKMIPIYRLIDLGYQGLKNNYATFSACYEALNRNQTIMIFPEGSTLHEKRLRPIQKGIGRIIAGAYQQYPDMQEIFVVPIGVNFTYAEQPRGEAMIDIGEPIPTRALFEGHPSQAAHTLTKILTSALEERVVIIREEADEELAEYLLLLDRSTRPSRIFPVRSADIAPLKAEKKVCEQLNALSSEHKQQLLHAARTYFSALNTHGLEDWALHRQDTPRPSTRFLHLLATLPAWLGLLFCLPPMALAHYIRKTQVERPEFFSPILLASSMGAFVLYYLLWLLLASYSGQWAIPAAALLLSLLGYFGMLHREQGRRLEVLRRKHALSPSAQAHLLELRQQLLKLF